MPEQPPGPPNAPPNVPSGSEPATSTRPTQPQAAPSGPAPQLVAPQLVAPPFAGQAGQPAGQAGQPAGQAGQFAGQVVQVGGQQMVLVPALVAVAPAPSAAQTNRAPAGQPGQFAGQPGQFAGQPAGQAGQPAGQAGQFAGQPGQPTGQVGQPAGQPGQPAGQPGQPTGQPGQPTGHAGHAAPFGAPAHPHKRSAGGTVVRVLVAAAVLGGIGWYVHSRGEHKGSADENGSNEPGGHGIGKIAGAEGRFANGSGGSGGSGGPGGSGGSNTGADRGGGAPGGREGRGGGSGSGGPPVVVQVAPVERKDLPIWIEGLGSVAPFQQVTVRPQVDGKLERVAFTEGQFVKKGDLLAQVDARPFVVALHQAQGALARDQAQLETDKVNLERYKNLKAQNLVAGQQVEEIAGQVGQLEGTVKIDRAQIESAQLNIDYCSVRAPLDGVVGLRQVDAGNLVHQTDTNGIVVITAIDPAAVLFTIPQDKLADVTQALQRGNATVEVYNRDGQTKIGTGALAVIDNAINQSTATLRLKALVPNPDRALWPNAFVKARLLVNTKKDAVVIPSVAIQHGPSETFVYLVGPDKVAQQHPVTVGLVTGDVAVVTKGLNGGEQVVIEGQNQLRPGSRVAPGGGNDKTPGEGVPGGPGKEGASKVNRGEDRPNRDGTRRATSTGSDAGAPGTSGGAAPSSAGSAQGSGSAMGVGSPVHTHRGSDASTGGSP